MLKLKLILLVLFSLTIGFSRISYSAAPKDDLEITSLLNQLESKDLSKQRKARGELIENYEKFNDKLIKARKKKGISDRLWKEIMVTLELIKLKKNNIKGGKSKKGVKAFLNTYKTKYKIGEDIHLQFILQNMSDKDLVLLYGSYSLQNWKPGLGYIEIFDEKGNLVKLKTFPGGKISIPAKKWFKTIKPDHIISPPSNHLNHIWKPKQPGKYKIIIHYNSLPYYVKNFIGKNKEYDKLIKRIPEINISTNELTIEIVSKK